MLFRLLRVVALGSALLAMNAAAVSADGNARVRVLHASPDAPAVDVLLDGTIVPSLTNVPFGVISGYLTVPAGEHNVKVVATGTDTAVIDATVTLAAGTSYTIAAIGPVASIQPKIFVDDPNPQAGSAKVRVVHLSPDAPAVDVAPDGADPADAVVKNLAYPDATDYLALPPGSYDLEVRVAGTTTVALQLDPLSLAAGRAYSVFAIGSAAAEPLGGNALRVLVAVDGVAAPATDTVGATGPGDAPATPLWILALLGLAGSAVAGAYTLRTRQVRDR